MKLALRIAVVCSLALVLHVSGCETQSDDISGNLAAHRIFEKTQTDSMPHDSSLAIRIVDNGTVGQVRFLGDSVWHDIRTVVYEENDSSYVVWVKPSPNRIKRILIKCVAQFTDSTAFDSDATYYKWYVNDSLRAQGYSDRFDVAESFVSHNVMIRVEAQRSRLVGISKKLFECVVSTVPPGLAK